MRDQGLASIRIKNSKNYIKHVKNITHKQIYIKLELITKWE